MKKTFSKKSTIVIIAAVVALVAVIAAYVFIPVKVKDISGIDEDRQIVYLGETLEPEYTVEPAKLKDKKYEIKFYMSDPEVANVDDKGCITANKLGETVLTLTVLNYEEEVTIVVVPNVTEITNISNTIELVEGDCKTIKPKLVFAEKRFSGEKVKYLIEDKNIASINSKGTIKAINPGITKLTITAGGREKTVKIIINVAGRAPAIKTTRSVATKRKERICGPRQAGASAGAAAGSRAARSRPRPSVCPCTRAARTAEISSPYRNPQARRSACRFSAIYRVYPLCLPRRAAARPV